METELFAKLRAPAEQVAMALGMNPIVLATLWDIDVFRESDVWKDVVSSLTDKDSSTAYLLRNFFTDFFYGSRESSFEEAEVEVRSAHHVAAMPVVIKESHAIVSHAVFKESLKKMSPGEHEKLLSAIFHEELEADPDNCGDDDEELVYLAASRPTWRAVAKVFTDDFVKQLLTV